MNLNPFIHLISICIDLYRWALISWIFVNLLMNFQILNPYQPLVRKLSTTLDQLVQPALTKVRQYIPHIRGIDLSSLVLLILLGFIKEVMYSYFYHFGA